MSNLGTIKKVVWSFDAFEERENLHANVARVLSVFQGKAFVQIEPVFVLVATSLAWQADFAADWMADIRQNVRRQMEEALLKAGFPYVLCPKILIEPLASTTASVENLLAYAEQQKADLIVVSSHGRQGLDRFFLGSFAETLLAHSAIPVMVVGGAVKSESHLSQILFPTDFGDHSRYLFYKTVTLAKQMGSQLRIFHSVPIPSRAIMDSGFYPAMYGVEGEMVTFDDFMKIQWDHQMRRAEAWAEWAKSQGVSCGFKVDSSDGALVDLICREAEASQCDLIAMEGQGGPVRVAILGSTTRSVVRAATCPVLVFPKQTSEISAQVESPSEGPLEFEI